MKRREDYTDNSFRAELRGGDEFGLACLAAVGRSARGFIFASLNTVKKA